jgi:protein-L-isoaspartate(D-aspartate) O-methyltransferase
MEMEIARGQMIRQQIRPAEVLDGHVLQIFSELARDEFVPAKYQELAYADTQIPLPHGECMMMPSVEGRLLQALDVKAGESVLEIGTGSGYLTACLGKLGMRVTSIDFYEDFIKTARERLADSGIANCSLQCMDATKELPAGEFDVIAVTGSTPLYDSRYANALKTGGRLFVIVGSEPLMKAQLITRLSATEFRTETLFETTIPPLRNAAEPTAFNF